MSSKQERFRIAVLDDYQRAALSFADWSVLDVNGWQDPRLDGGRGRMRVL